MDDTRINVLGVMAEFAVAKRVGGKMDTRIYVNHGDRHKADVDNGKSTFDVKYNNYNNGHYYHRTLEMFKADYGALVLPSDYEDSVLIFGFVSHANFMQNYEIVNFGYGNLYGLPQTYKGWIDA